MLAQALIYQFTINERVCALNCTGISEDEALITLHGSSSLNWIVGHILRCRSDLLREIDQQPFTGVDEYLYYRPKHEVDDRSGEVVTLASLLDDLHSQHAEFCARVSVGIEDARQSASEDRVKHISFRCFHESYHVGQLGLMRRIIGKEGMIR